MSKRRSKSPRKKKNSFTIFFIIVIILALLSFAISYFVTQTEDKAVGNITNSEEVSTVLKHSTTKSNLEGTWASYADGAMLTITGQRFSIELPSVENTIIATGKITVVGNIVTFIYTNNDSVCGTDKGVYKFKVQGTDEVTFEKISDNCDIRVAQIAVSWFKV